jgi:hypothetical protein
MTEAVDAAGAVDAQNAPTATATLKGLTTKNDPRLRGSGVRRYSDRTAFRMRPANNR